MCADIDEQLAPVVEALWRNGFKTLTSCQDAGESNADWTDLLPHMATYVESRRGWAFIDFPVDSGLAFLNAIAKAGPRDAFYVRMTHWAAPESWDVSIRPFDVAMLDETRESDFGLRLLQVCFPVHDLAEILRRLERYEAGDLVAAAPADWTTVGRPRRTAMSTTNLLSRVCATPSTMSTMTTWTEGHASATAVTVWSVATFFQATTRRPYTPALSRSALWLSSLTGLTSCEGTSRSTVKAHRHADRWLPRPCPGAW
jgi:hypothetical protein